MNVLSGFGVPGTMGALGSPGLMGIAGFTGWSLCTVYSQAQSWLTARYSVTVMPFCESRSMFHKKTMLQCLQVIANVKIPGSHYKARASTP